MNFKFWAKSGLKNAGIVIAGCIGFGLIMALMNFADGETDKLVLMTCLFFILFGSMMFSVIVMATYSQFHLALSFGSTRKNAFKGMYVERAAYVVTILAAAAILLVLSPYKYIEVNTFAALTAILGYLLLADTLGAIGGIASLRSGAKAAISIVMILNMLIVAGTALLIISSIRNGSGILTPALGITMMCIGIVINAIAAIFERREAMQVTVRL